MIMTNLSRRMTTILGVSLSFIMVSCSTKDMAAVGQSPFPSNAAGFSNSVAVVGKESTYVDGVHTAIGKYGNRDSSISVTITLVGDVITGVQITPLAKDPTSLDLQQRFADAIPAFVVGNRIDDEVKLDRLKGSNRTPDAFKAAIEQIKEQNRIGPTTHRH
jgi:hypothetical protein